MNYNQPIFIAQEVFTRWILTISPCINKFNDLMQFIQHVKNIGKIPYTLRAYAKGLEHILEPIINKISCIEKRIKSRSE